MKKVLLSFLFLMALLLSGCSHVDNYIEEQMREKSGVLEDENYQQYEEFLNAGQIDSDGFVLEDATEATTDHAQVWVTFSKNKCLNIQYYLDVAHQNVVDTENCYLNPGESIYAVVSVDNDAVSSMYNFSEFRIYEYDEEGNRKMSSTLKMSKTSDQYVLSIPEDYCGTDISLEPMGEYQQRSITLNDYYSDDSDQHSLAGVWTINDKEYTGTTAEISPVTSYIVSYEFDSNEYFYLSSNPECYYVNNEDGIVIFKQREAGEETVDYSVELHKYLTVTLVSDIDRTVKVNGENKGSISAGNEVIIDHLQYGDTVVIETNAEWPDLETSRDLICISTEQKTGTTWYRYTLIVPEKDGEFLFNPDEYSYEHGTITFKCFGQVVTAPQILAKGSRIYYEKASAENGYWLAGKASQHYVEVGEEAETVNALKAIHFTPMVDVTVNLPQPKVGGSVTYKLNGNRVTGTSVSAHSGDTIAIKFIPWEGWISDANIDSSYAVGDSKTQTVMVNINGKDVNIDNVFREGEEHKPELTLNLEKSVDKNMQFTLNASGYSMDAENYGGGWKVTDIFDKDAGKYNIFTNTQNMVSGQKIGTDKPISIAISNRARHSGKAVRVRIVLTESNGSKTKDVRYITDLSNTIAPIYIYSPGANASSTIWYKSVEITIGVVNIETFTQPTAGTNTKITVKNKVTGKILTNGDFVEPDSDVTVTISPRSGYYVTGKNVSNDIYVKTMEYSKYQKNISSIISEHPATKYYTVTLDESDTYASYTYKLDGKKVSGVIKVKVGQKLQLTYKIKDSKYELSKAHGGILFNLGASKEKATETVSITADMNGKTITKLDFGIETVKVG